MGFLQSLSHSQSESWHWLPCLFPLNVASDFSSGDRLAWLFARLALFGLDCLLLHFLLCLFWFGFLLFRLFLFHLFFGLLFLFLSRRFGTFRINIKQRLSYIEAVTSIDMEFYYLAGMRAFNLDSNFISFDISNSLILFNPISLFCKLFIKKLLLTNSAIVPSLIESAKKGKFTVLAKW